MLERSRSRCSNNGLFENALRTRQRNCPSPAVKFSCESHNQKAFQWALFDRVRWAEWIGLHDVQASQSLAKLFNRYLPEVRDFRLIRSTLLIQQPHNCWSQTRIFRFTNKSPAQPVTLNADHRKFSICMLGTVWQTLCLAHKYKFVFAGLFVFIVFTFGAGCFGGCLIALSGDGLGCQIVHCGCRRCGQKRTEATRGDQSLNVVIRLPSTEMGVPIFFVAPSSSTSIHIHYSRNSSF